MYTIINGGYFTKHPPSFSMERPMGFAHHVFLYIRSEAILCINGHNHTVTPNSYLFIKPDTPYSYSNPKGAYMDDWIHFDCTEATSLPPHLFHEPFSCNNPAIISTYMEQLVWENNFAPEEFRQENTRQLFQIILRHVLQDFYNQNGYQPYRFQMQKQRISMQSAPYMNHRSETMACSLGISMSYYEHLYKTFFGQSFRSDLISMRIDYAKELIKNTTLPLEQVAYKCGYNSEVHFYRQFLAKTGTTPGNYRTGVKQLPLTGKETNSMKKNELYNLWKQEESIAHIHGWDFSHIEGKYMEEDDLPWNYKDIIGKYLTPTMRILDFDTGGGEFLLSLGHTHSLTAATEGFPPNVELCKETLLPLGIDFKSCDDEANIPYADESFDIIINRHGSFDPKELHRLLKKGGLFITQQVGEDNDRELVEMALPGTPKQFSGLNLKDQTEAFKHAGFHILESDEAFRPIRFYDIGAFVWFARIIEWEFPGFSVDSCFENLLKMQKIQDEKGCVEGTIHRYYLVAQK